MGSFVAKKGKGWTGENVACTKCLRKLRSSRFALHQLLPECITMQWRHKLHKAGWVPSSEFSVALDRADVTVQRPTTYYIETDLVLFYVPSEDQSYHVNEQIISFDSWSPAWAMSIARLKQGKLKFADARIRLIKAAAASEMAKTFIEDDPLVALEMLDDSEI